MREQVAERIVEDDGDELLSTGEAASLLGVSRQHIVDLCNEGQLPFTRTGKHRRIRRGDLDLLRAGSQRTSVDQLRSLLLAHATAGNIVLDPDHALSLARHNLEQMKRTSARGSARIWLEEWERLLKSPLPELLAALTGPSVRSRELRQNSPFAGLLDDDDRRRVLVAARSAARKPTP